MSKRRPRDIVQGSPIAGFVGINGAGKTALAVESAIADLARGREVYSTVQIECEFGASKPIESLRQLLTLRDVTILLDEVAVIFSSRSTHSLPAEIVMLLQTVRHARNTVRWTAPAWMRADTLLRSVTQAVVAVNPLLRVPTAGDLWPRPRFVYAAVLDTSTGKADSMPERTLRRRLYRLRGLHAIGAYDTHADTPMLGRHLHSGVCLDCGGSMERPKHSAARHEQLGIPLYDVDVHIRPRAADPVEPAADTLPATEEAPA